ncbi:MAG: hypothetical protein GXO65_02960 [Euryarchaeota archaeon]|nr:hypothetical protein [Euryarchaeota archaeon]
MKGLVVLAAVILLLGCIGGMSGSKVGKEEASNLALQKYTSLHPNRYPRVLQVVDRTSKWRVELETSDSRPSYYVDKGSGEVTITQEYALEISLTDPYVDSLYQRNQPQTYYEFDGRYWTIRYISQGTEILVVTVDSVSEEIADIDKKIIEIQIG